MPHAVHDAKGLNHLMGNYIDDKKGTVVKYRSRVFPSNLLKEYQVAVSIDKDSVEHALSARKLAGRALKKSESAGAIIQRRN